MRTLPKHKKNKDDEKDVELRKKERIEEAKKLANKSQKIINNNYNAISRFFIRFFHWFNSLVDYIVRSSFLAKVVALILAILLFLSSQQSGDRILGQSTFGKELYGVPVELVYDSSLYQVENLPKTVDLSLTGSLDAIRTTDNYNNVKVVADLTNYSAGMNQKVNLIYGGIESGVNVKFSQHSYEVNIFKRYSKEFSISPELINLPIEKAYEYSVDLAKNNVIIKAANHTLDQIAGVKALVDVGGKDSDFSQKAILVAVDNKGNRLENITFAFKEVEVNVKLSKIKG